MVLVACIASTAHGRDQPVAALWGFETNLHFDPLVRAEGDFNAVPGHHEIDRRHVAGVDLPRGGDGAETTQPEPHAPALGLQEPDAETTGGCSRRLSDVVGVAASFSRPVTAALASALSAHGACGLQDSQWVASTLRQSRWKSQPVGVGGGGWSGKTKGGATNPSAAAVGCGTSMPMPSRNGGPSRRGPPAACRASARSGGGTAARRRAASSAAGRGGCREMRRFDLLQAGRHAGQIHAPVQFGRFVLPGEAGGIVRIPRVLVGRRSMSSSMSNSITRLPRHSRVVCRNPATRRPCRSINRPRTAISPSTGPAEVTAISSAAMIE